MFDFWPVYSGEQFRASWPSCYVMGKALMGELSCLVTGHVDYLQYRALGKREHLMIIEG